jgi:PII-like signaling protein
MRINNPSSLLRIFVSSTDHLKQDSLCESIVFAAKNYGLVVIEIIDEEEKIRGFYETIRPQLETMRYGCLVTIQNIDVLLFKSGKGRG